MKFLQDKNVKELSYNNCGITFTFINSVVFAKLPGLWLFVFVFEVRQSKHVQLGRMELFTFVDSEQKKSKSFHNTHLFWDHRLVEYVAMFRSYNGKQAACYITTKISSELLGGLLILEKVFIETVHTRHGT